MAEPATLSEGPATPAQPPAAPTEPRAAPRREPTLTTVVVVAVAAFIAGLGSYSILFPR